jgi:hypothetical protein
MVLEAISKIPKMLFGSLFEIVLYQQNQRFYIINKEQNRLETIFEIASNNPRKQTRKRKICCLLCY